MKFHVLRSLTLFIVTFHLSVETFNLVLKFKYIKAMDQYFLMVLFNMQVGGRLELYFNEFLIRNFH